MRYLVQTARPIFEDLVGTLAFYLLFILTKSLILAAMVGLAIGVAQVLGHKFRREPVPGLLLLGVMLTVTLGGLSLLTHNARILLLKPSIIYCCIGATMLPRGWVTRYVPDIARSLLPDATLDRVGWAWASLMFGTAAANVLLVGVLPPQKAAMWLLAIATASKLVLFAIQYVVLRARVAAAFYASSTQDAADK